MVEPGLMFEVKLLEILQRNPLLLITTAVQQSLHAALKDTGVMQVSYTCSKCVMLVFCYQQFRYVWFHLWRGSQVDDAIEGYVRLKLVE